MSIEVRVPALGESIVEATIAAWRKREGEPVAQGEVLVELETDKVNQEIFAEQGGILQKILKQEGETVGIGDVLAVIAEGAAREAVATQPAPAAQKSAAPALSATPQATPAEQIAATPLARRIAAEHHLDLSQIKPEGIHERLTKEDVLDYLERSAPQAASPAQAIETAPLDVAPSSEPAWTPLTSPAPTQPPVLQPTKAGFLEAPAPSGVPLDAPRAAPVRREERVRMSRRRQTIAQRLVQAQHTAAMLTTFNEIDMSAIMEVRKRRRDSFKERHGVSLGFMSFFTKAVVGALKAFPRLNAEIQGDEMVLKYYYDIGIAVGAEEGLVVPVVRDADRKTFAEIEREIADLAKRARENALTLPELQGGTFTITNGGVFGSLLSTPILNGPQVGILGMHKIEERPIALNGQVVIRPMMYVAVSYDHRIVDGREAVQFLVRVKELLEDPEALLLEG
jgi:2-oxoglutarate dehydrogenase E2 component (dihydrolipoamide succinyltransferase)